MNNLAGGVFSGPLDLQLIVTFIILIVRTDPVVNVYFRLSRPLSLHELALNAIIGSCQGAVHRLDILDIVELMAVFEVQREWVLLLEGQCLSRICKQDILAPHAVTRISIIVQLFFDNEIV